MAMADQTVLNYHNSLLRQSDVDLLKGNHWLNDRLIGFWLEYLENEVFSDNSVCFISPEVGQLIKLISPEEVALVLEELNLETKHYILIPVNDSISLDSPGGFHWSLLVYSSATREFYHFDSMNRANEREARKIATNLNLSQPINFYATDTLQQPNHWDCGIYVCCYAQFIVYKCLNEKCQLKCLPPLDHSVVKEQRKTLLNIISKLTFN